MSIYESLGQLEEHLATTSGRLFAAITATFLLASLLVRCLPSEPDYHADIPTVGLDSSKTTKSLAQARQDWCEFGKQIIHQGLAQVRNFPLFILNVIQSCVLIGYQVPELLPGNDRSWT